MRVLHAPVNVGNQAWVLSRAERSLGIKSDVIVYSSPGLGFPYDRNLEFDKISGRWAAYRKYLSFFLHALRSYDVFHFYFAKTLLPYGVDLPLLRLLGKKIFCTYLGSEVRFHRTQTSFKGQPLTIFYNDPKDRVPDRVKKFRIWFMRLFANHIFVKTPDLFLSVPRATLLPQLIDYLSDWLSVPPAPTTQELRVLHAPTNRVVKGTDHIVAAIEKLRGQGVPIRLELIENLNYKQMMKKMLQVDVVIDNLEAGWFGTVSVEAMAAGKTVLCSMKPVFMQFVPFAHKVPVIPVSTATLESVLRDLANHREKLHSNEARGRAFVQSYYHPEKVVKDVLRYYQA